jgi:hypothetical protein
MDSDPLLLKASLAFAALMAGAAYLPGDFIMAKQPMMIAEGKAPVTVAAEGIDVALRDYETVRVSGDPLERCAKANAVALAYLRAEDRAGYQTWESVGAQNCAAAGFHSQAETAALLPAEGLSSTATKSPIVAPRGGGT